MNFEEEHEDHEEEMGIPAAPLGYDSLGNSGGPKMGATVGAEGGASTITPNRKGRPTGSVRYRECQKNHAVSLGGHAVDGCGEFMAAGEDGTLDALRCAACNCHRNFHRKEIEGEMSSYHHQQPPQPHHQYHHQFSPYYRAPPLPPTAGYIHHHLATPPLAQHRPLALPAAASGGRISREDEDMSNPSSSGGGGVGGGGSGSDTKKRFRTKFTQEQKEKMLAFSESVGWRIQKHDEAAVEQFCTETCVKRKVLKVWMHNNKNTLGEKVTEGEEEEKLARVRTNEWVIHAANPYTVCLLQPCRSQSHCRCCRLFLIIMNYCAYHHNSVKPSSLISLFLSSFSFVARQLPLNYA